MQVKHGFLRELKISDALKHHKFVLRKNWLERHEEIELEITVIEHSWKKLILLKFQNYKKTEELSCNENAIL